MQICCKKRVEISEVIFELLDFIMLFYLPSKYLQKVFMNIRYSLV